MFNKLIWQNDRMLLNDLVFRLQHYKNEQWDVPEGSYFTFYKIKKLVDQYKNFFSGRTDFKAGNIFELGMWDGGSIAFWYEYFKPDKHVGVDLSPKKDSPYFQQYIQKNNLTRNIKTFWGIDQADSSMIRKIYDTEFNGELDLVIDDASHLYGPSKKSFETLFPLLRPGGLYIIEDWAWGHWQDFFGPKHYWAKETVLSKLIFELIESAGTRCDLISNITIFEGFTVIERGAISRSELSNFRLDDFILRRPEYKPSFKEKIKVKLKKLLR